jgi:hypothetical protein
MGLQQAPFHQTRTSQLAEIAYEPDNRPISAGANDSFALWIGQNPARVSRSSATVLALGLALAPSVARADAVTSACVDASDAGQASRDRGELRRARESFTACAAERCPRALRADCARWLEDVDRDMPTVVVGVKDELGGDVLDGKVLLDGAPVSTGGAPIALDPGIHVFHFERPGAPPVEKRIVVRTGERNRLVVEQVASGPAAAKTPEAKVTPRSGGIPTASWIFGAVGVAGLASFGVLGGLGLAEKSQLGTTCSPGCSDDQVARLRGLYIGADISLGVGLVGLVAATFIALAASGPSTRATASVVRF